MGSLPVGKAWAMLAGALLLLVASLALAPWSTELGLAPLENSPAVMIHRAQDLARKFGYKAAPKDAATWYARNVSFLAGWARNHRPSDKFGDLKSAPQGHHKF